MQNALLDQLEQNFPISQRLDLPGFPTPVWVWRLDIDAFSELKDLSGSETVTPFGIRVVQLGIRDEQGAAVFDSERGAAWLKANSTQALQLAEAVAGFNKLPSRQSCDDR